MTDTQYATISARLSAEEEQAGRQHDKLAAAFKRSLSPAQLQAYLALDDAEGRCIALRCGRQLTELQHQVPGHDEFFAEVLESPELDPVEAWGAPGA